MDKKQEWQDLKFKEHEERITKLEKEAQPSPYFENLNEKERKELKFMLAFLIILICITIIYTAISTIK